MVRKSALTKTQLEAKIPAGPVSEQMRRQLAIGNEVLEVDDAGFAILVRQTVGNKCTKLRDKGFLSAAETEAALRMRAYEDACYQGTGPSFGVKVDVTRRPGAALIEKLHAAKELEDALRSLSPQLRKVTKAFILERDVPGMGTTLISIGGYYQPSARSDDQRIAGRTLVKAACRDLAVHFGLQNEDQ